MLDGQYTTTDIVDKLKVPMQRLRMWLLNGYFSPSIPSAGQGQKAYFSLFDLYAIAVFIQLLDQGCKRELAAEYVKRYQESYQGKEVEAQAYANYLIFVTEIVKEDRKIKMLTFTGYDHLQLKLEAAKISLVNYDGETLLDECLWANVMVVNFGLIKGLVDSKLGV